MSDPNISQINLTVVLSVVTIALTAMGTLVAIFRKKIRDDEKPGKSPFCIQNKNDFKRLENETKESGDKIEKIREESTKKFEELKQLLNDTGTEVSVLKNESVRATKSLDEMKKDVKQLASKLDDLLKQLLDWMVD